MGKAETFADTARKRVIVEGVQPQVDCGRHPVKRVVGDTLTVETDLVADGHDELAGVLRYRHADDAQWSERALTFLVNDRWRGAFPLSKLGRWQYTVEAWVDRFSTWRNSLARKAEAGQDVDVDLRLGARLVAAAAGRADGEDARLLADASRKLDEAGGDLDARVALALDVHLAQRMGRHPDRSRASRFDRVLEVVVDRPRARFSAWYEMFPRSCGASGKHGTFRDAEQRLPYVAELGFDVLYLPPIHPIGRTHRKGGNNALQAQPGEPGSPWAIGAAEGGHKAIHPDLGTLDDFRRFIEKAGEHGLEVALDIAFQCSPDHPYVREHPEWFLQRPDGSIQYAENPPKKYQDIYPFDFDSESWESLWEELLSVFTFWIDQGVRIFRVDNPHTKSLRFWQWCLGEIRSRHPDVIFLAEAFTRPKLMYELAKLGFTQSYTYFTWRNTRHELTEYLQELTQTDVHEFFRPNFWPNTPDILPEALQHGGRPAFIARLVLAATLSSNYGIYGPAFELMEHVPRPGSEEYVDNEKYELRDWDIHRADSLRYLIAHLNRIRRQHPALQHNGTLAFHPTDNDQLLCYSKRDHEADDVMLVVVNLDFHHRHSGWTHLDLRQIDVDGAHPYEVHDLITDARYYWEGSHNYVELDPSMPAHVFHVVRTLHGPHQTEHSG
jgi:starch synthase (maltosyl-transferring)